MGSLHPEFVIDKDKHTNAGLLPFSEWKKDERIPFNQAIREIRDDYNA